MKLALTAALLFAAPFLKASPVYYSVVDSIVGYPSSIEASIKIPGFVENLPFGAYVASGDEILACSIGNYLRQTCQKIPITINYPTTSKSVNQITFTILSGVSIYDYGYLTEFHFLNVPMNQFGTFISQDGYYSLVISTNTLTPEPSSLFLLTSGLIVGWVVWKTSKTIA